MSNVRSIRDAKATSRRASEWLVLLESGEATEDDRARFDAWRREHPGNQAAFDELKHTWARLRAMRHHLRSGEIDAGDPDAVEKYLARSHRRRSGFTWGAVAALLIVAVGSGALLYPLDSGRIYRTDVGQQMTVTLSDGSTVELNTDTELRVAYTRTARDLELRRGEAYFEVAHDADRPFVVKAGHGAVRAVGTGFAVEMKPNDVVAVTVTEGIVAVTHDAQREPDTSLQPVTVNDQAVPTLSKGQRVEYSRHIGHPAAVSREELERDLSWRHGMLIFDDQTLDQVLREVGRYTETKLVITDGELRQLRIGGAFRAGDVDALLEVLEKGFNIAVHRRGPRDGPQTVYLGASRAAGTG